MHFFLILNTSKSISIWDLVLNLDAGAYSIPPDSQLVQTWPRCLFLEDLSPILCLHLKFQASGACLPRQIHGYTSA